MPHNNHFIEFESRRSDTLNDMAIALVDAEGVFQRWVRKKGIAVIRRRIETGKRLAGKLSYIREYNWGPGDGLCCEGELILYIAE
jgi:hypothetical protein